MHERIRAGTRRRTRHAVRAILPALLAFALPAAANAATVQVVTVGSRMATFSADPGEANNVRVSLTAAGIVFDDQVPIRAVGSECRIDAAGNGVCPANVDSIHVITRDGNDRIQYTAPHKGAVMAGDGSDIIFGGLRQAGFGRQIEPVQYIGNETRTDPGVDTVSYSQADRGVSVDLGDAHVTQNPAYNDGRPGIDREHIFSDIEVIEGSPFADPQLFGSDRHETFRGLGGDDVIGTGGGDDYIDESDANNGADTLNGGNGNDRVLYTGRASGVIVSLDGVRNDGAPGERDDVRPSVEHVNGTDSVDTLIGKGAGEQPDRVRRQRQDRGPRRQ
ncbi:MAG TPA: hypothetical protein VFZ00_06355 [Solirubrobacter sp.]|nr:hypothetical protein [Solirubrobacter sp.]